jgi:cytochrome c-type biogenesis protein CcmH
VKLAATVLAAALSLLALSAPALAATPQTSITDVEDEVMCPICGTLLELAESPQAKRERVLVRRLIAEGKSKDEIKDALVAQYGRQVLALPGGSGFDLSAYLVPAVAFVVAVAALAFGVRRWRRAAKPPGATNAAAEGPEGEDAERLDADLARYDL